MKNAKNLIIKITIFSSIIVLLMVTGTLAAWIWRSEVNKDVVFNTSKEIQEYIIYNAGDSKFVGNFQPTDTFCSGQHTTISFYKTEEAENVPLYATINMDINSIDRKISVSTDVYWILTKGDTGITCNNALESTDVIQYGNFHYKNGETVELKNNIPITTEEQQFTIWVWIDSNGEDLSSLSGETLDVNIWTQIDMIPNEGLNQNKPNAPVLDNGMIPVTINNNGEVFTVSKNDPYWYDYKNKQWANVVLVTDSSRSNYLNNLSKNIQVNEEDILAYYVWIPRYKYKIWNTYTAILTNPQTINIKFESANEPVTTNTFVDDYITHPAFIWDGGTIAGIWVGKFELSHSILANFNSSNNLECKDENCSNADGLIIKPNVKALKNNSVSNFFYASRSMTRNENPFGLNFIQTDSHIIKNSEWGAVAYLSHSDYGLNQEIRINNNSNLITGCGALSDTEASNTDCTLEYGSDITLYPQSTTGNITGIFDMSGGLFEYVMGYYINGTDQSGFSVYPTTKYFETHDITTMNSCSLSICAGRALYETAGWYSDTKNLPTKNYPWFHRGGRFSSGVAGGIWNIGYGNGNAGSEYGTRSILISKT